MGKKTLKMGKKKKRDKHTGLSLSRIGACLVPGAIFAAVPSTAQSYSETWPRRKKNLSALSTVLGSIGNLAQAVVVADGEQLNANAGTISNEALQEIAEDDDYESEGHYAIVDENILNGTQDENIAENNNNTSKVLEKTPVEAIYAKVNKNRKPQKEQENHSSGDSEDDDITSVSGMGSEDEDSSTTVSHFHAKKYSKKSGSKKRNGGKDKLMKNSQVAIKEAPFTKIDINDNLVMTGADFNDDFVEENYPTDQEIKFQNEFLQSSEGTQHNKCRNIDDANIRNVKSPNQFEQEKFNETNVEKYSAMRTPLLTPGRNKIPSVASASDFVNHSPEIPPIGERENPIGKGISMETIDSYYDEYHPLAHSVKHQELVNECSDRHWALEQSYEEDAVKHKEEKAQKHEKKNGQKRLKEIVEQQQPEQQEEKRQQQQQHQQQQQALDEQFQKQEHQLKPQQKQLLQLQQEEHTDPQPQKFLQRQVQAQFHQKTSIHPHERQKKFSQNAELIRQQIEVANKLRAFSAQGFDEFPTADLIDGNFSKQKSFNEATNNNSLGDKQESFTSSETHKSRAKMVGEGKPTDGIISAVNSRYSESYEESKAENRRNKRSRPAKDDPSTTARGNHEGGKSPTSTLQQMSTTMAKEACRKLYLRVKTLDRENSALQTLSQSLNEENTTLKKLNESLTKNNDTSSSGQGISLSLLQIQIEELKDENSFLKDSVHRLNVELGRYQAKYRSLSPQELDEMLKTDKNQPVWLVNKKYIAPLFLAYDDRIKEKQQIIEAYENQLQSLKNSLQEIIDENEQLQQKLVSSEAAFHDEKEWRQLEKQAQLVLSENEVLMERQELQNKKLEELTAFYKGEVSQLSQQYEKAQAERSGLESKIEVLNTTLSGYKQELEASSSLWNKRISVEEHLDKVNECRRKLEELRKKTQEEIDSLTFQLESARNDHKSLALQLTDLKQTNAQLEREIQNFTDVQRKNERKMLLLKEKLSHIHEREACAQDTLNEVLKVAERTVLERDALNEMLSNKQLENKKVQTLVRMEEDKLKECKNKASLKITAIKGRVVEQEREAEILKDRYENEIKNLKILVRRQQRQLEDMVNDKRNLENELTVIHEKIGYDINMVED